LRAVPGVGKASRTASLSCFIIFLFNLPSSRIDTFINMDVQVYKVLRVRPRGLEMPYTDPSKQRAYMRELMKKRRAKQRVATKYVRDRVKTFLKAVGVSTTALKGKDVFLMLRRWLFPTFFEGLRKMSDKYTVWLDMLQQIKHGITEDPTTLARGMAQALSHIDGRFMNLALWIMDLEDILSFAPQYFEFNKKHEEATFFTLVESFAENQPLEPDHQPGQTLIIQRMVKKAEYKEYAKKVKKNVE
jgi:hypothetical protein